MSGRRQSRRAPNKQFPHCPNRSCRFHRPDARWSFRPCGLYRRPSDGRRYQRYQCCQCRRTFSLRTFSADYWLRYRHLLIPIANLSVNGAALRQIGRVLEVSHATVARHLARAGRHCLLFQREQLQGTEIHEPLAMDGFETFEYSQFFPCHLNLAAGKESWFLYHFTDSPLRRKGRMTPQQKIQRALLEARLGRPSPRAIQTGIRQLLEALPLGNQPLTLHSDDHPAYPRALKDFLAKRSGLHLEHRITPSTEPRTPCNPLFACNLSDLLLRHSGANHHRETIAFSKRRQGALERLAVFAVWRNWVKRRREKKAGETAAMAAGLSPGPLRWGQILVRRRFPRRELLPRPWNDYYWRRIKTAALGASQTTHSLTYAF